MAEWPPDALHSVAKKFIASMNLPRAGNDETIDVDEQSTQLANDHDDEIDASRLELSEFQLKLARMAIYLYDSVKIANER